MAESDLGQVQADLAALGVLEPDGPPRFTRRFQGALTRAAADLQAMQEAGTAVPGHPIQNQVETALAAFLAKAGKKIGREHRLFVVALHLESLPAAVRRLLGV